MFLFCSLSVSWTILNAAVCLEIFLRQSPPTLWLVLYHFWAIGSAFQSTATRCLFFCPNCQKKGLSRGRFNVLFFNFLNGLTLTFLGVLKIEWVHKLGLVVKWWAHFESMEHWTFCSSVFIWHFKKDVFWRTDNGMAAIVPLWFSDCLSTRWACLLSVWGASGGKYKFLFICASI